MGLGKVLSTLTTDMLVPVSADDFNASNTTNRTTTSSGAAWIQTAGVMGVSSNQGTIQSFPVYQGGYYAATPALESGHTNHRMEFTPTGGAFGYFVRGIGGHIQTGTYFVSDAGYVTSGDLFVGTGSTAGSYSFVAGSVVSSVAPGARVAIEAVGTTLNIYKNGSLTHTRTISDNGGTQVGFYFSSYNSSVGAVRVEDVAVYAIY